MTCAFGEFTNYRERKHTCTIQEHVSDNIIPQTHVFLAFFNSMFYRRLASHILKGHFLHCL